MIPIGGDQASYTLKTSVIKHLQERNIEYFDVGNYDMEYDTNVLAIGGRIVSPELADEMTDVFPDTGFDPACAHNLEVIEQFDRELYKKEYLGKLK